MPNMAVWEFVRGLFAKEEQPIQLDERELLLDEVHGFLNQKFTQQDDVQANIEEFHKNIAEILTSARGNLDVLETAKLRNPNIGVKAKQIMEGNREAFIKRTKLFLDYLNPAEPTHENAQQLCDTFEKEVENYNKTTAKGYYVMQQFFANESRAVALNIKDLQSNMGQLAAALAQNDLQAKDKCFALLETLKQKLYLKEKLGLEQETLEREKQEFQKSIESYAQKKEKLSKSPGYKQFEKFQVEKESLVKQIRQKEQELSIALSPMQHAFKKFARMSVDEIFVEGYAKDSLNAFQHDADMKITKVLENIKKAVLDGSLELKDDKKNKAIDALAKLTPEFFSQWKAAYDDISAKRTSKERMLRSNVVMQEYNELQYRIEHYQHKIEKQNDKIAKLQKDKQKLSIEEVQKELEKQLRNCTNTIINLKLYSENKPKDNSDNQKPEVSEE